MEYITTAIEINQKCLQANTVIEIGKFTILWNIFEKEKCQNHCSHSKLVQLVSNITSDKNWEFLANTLKRRAYLTGGNIHIYIDKGLSMGDGISRPEVKQQIIDFINSDGRNSLAGGLHAIYRIRNNLFHGLKSWTDLDSQIELFMGLNDFLTYAIQTLERIPLTQTRR